MGRFFVLALIFVILLTAAPALILWSKDRSEDYEGKVISRGVYYGKIRSFDSAQLGDVDSTAMISNIYEPLYHYHYLKRPVVLEPVLAAQMPHRSDDDLVYTIPLRKGVLYNPNSCFRDENGNPASREVKAQDFVLAFKRVADPHLPVPLAWPLLGERIAGLSEWREIAKDYNEGDFTRYDLPVEGVAALDDYTLQFKLKKPFPQFLYVIAGHFFAPTPREVIDYYLASEDDGKGGRRETPMSKRTAKLTKMEQLVGTGVYMITKWDDGDQVIFERNPNHRREYYPTEGDPQDEADGLLVDAGKPIPFIDVIILNYVPQDVSVWQMFLSGQIDSTGIPKEVFEHVITPDKELEDEWKKRHINLRKSTYPTLQWLGFNMRDPVLGRSKALRQGLNLAYNVEDEIRVLWNGRGKRAINVVPSMFPANEMAGPGPYAHYNLEEAKAKIAQAKEELGPLGLLDKNGEIPPFELDLTGREEFDRRLGEFVQQQFASVGVRIKVNLNDWPSFQQKMRNKQMQVFMMGWHADYPDEENFLQLFYSPNIDFGTNDTNYSNPEFDALYDQIKYNMDEEDRRRRYVRMIQILSEDCPMVYRYEPYYFTLRYDWVKNGKPHPVGYGYSKYIRLDTALREQLKGH